jgi:hypothetical protein
MRWLKGAVMALGVGLVLAGCQTEQAADTGGGAGLFGDPGNYRPINMPRGVTMTPDQIRMDLVIKLQTELTVAGLACDQQYKDPMLFHKYGAWTIANGAMLNDVQDRMGRFLGQHGSGRGERLFDTYRTKMANDESALMNRMGIPAYCRARKDQYYTVTGYTPTQMAAYVDQLQTMYTPRYAPDARQPGAPLVAIVPPAGSPPIVAAAPAPSPAAPAAAAVASAAVPAVPPPAPRPAAAGIPAAPAAAATPAAAVAPPAPVPGQTTVLPIPPQPPPPVPPLPLPKPAR